MELFLDFQYSVQAYLMILCCLAKAHTYSVTTLNSSDVFIWNTLEVLALNKGKLLKKYLSSGVKKLSSFATPFSSGIC